MPHERRSGQRLGVLLRVLLRHSGNEAKECRVHNIAPEGMLLENNANLQNIGCEVELAVSRNDRTWNIAGVVTHCNSNCAGVMFNQRQSEFYRTVTRPTDSFSREISEPDFTVPKLS